MTEKEATLVMRSSDVSTQTVRVLGLDAGGTMTDTIAVDEHGRFVVGKARTTPDDESLGFVASVRDALGYWQLDPETAFPLMASGVFSGTSMLNRLLERKGLRLGLLVTRGMEDQLLLEQGVQTWLGYSYADLLHVLTHRHHSPLVPRHLVHGIGGRIDADGNEAIPLYEADVERATTALLDAGVETISILVAKSGP
jgi:acetone carboxylase, beta subunit